MTSLMCWVGADSRGLASAYITTDSRISWGDTGVRTWDYGRKTFASAASPDIFGYCGDVGFPSMALSQFVTALDTGICSGGFAQRFDALERLVRVTFAALPRSEQREFELVHCGRDGTGMSSSFGVLVLKWTRRAGFHRVEPRLRCSSEAILLEGSGAKSIKEEIAKWQGTPGAGTTRALYRAFADAINSDADPKSGGAPQMVGLYRIDNGLVFGTIANGQRFFNGMPVHDVAPDSEVRWHNQFFERANAVTRKRLPGAQRHTDLAGA